MGSLVAEAFLFPLCLSWILSSEWKHSLSSKTKRSRSWICSFSCHRFWFIFFIFFTCWPFRFVISVGVRECGRKYLPISIRGRKEQKLLCKNLPNLASTCSIWKIGTGKDPMVVTTKSKRRNWVLLLKHKRNSSLAYSNSQKRSLEWIYNGLDTPGAMSPVLIRMHDK